MGGPASVVGEILRTSRVDVSTAPPLTEELMDKVLRDIHPGADTMAGRDALLAICLNLDVQRTVRTACHQVLQEQQQEHKALPDLDKGKGKGKEKDASVWVPDNVASGEMPTKAASVSAFEHYKLKQHSFYEYRSEQDISAHLQVDEYETEEPRPLPTAAPARAYSGSRTNNVGGHAGQPGPLEEETWLLSIVLMSATCLISLGLLLVTDQQLYAVALHSEVVKTVAALTTTYADQWSKLGKKPK